MREIFVRPSPAYRPTGDPLVADAVFDGKQAKFTFDTFFPPHQRFYAYGILIKSLEGGAAPLRSGDVVLGFGCTSLFSVPAEAAISLQHEDPDFSQTTRLSEEIIGSLQRLLSANATVRELRYASSLLMAAARCSEAPSHPVDDPLRFSDIYCPITVNSLPYVIEDREHAGVRLDADVPKATGVKLRVANS